MPYITQDRRYHLIDGDIDTKDLTPGDLNYLITASLNDYLEEVGVSYTNLNTIIGVLECVKQEFYRRIAAPYEDQKKHENGDVYICQNN